MPDLRPLPLTPASSRRLAAAAPGEVVHDGSSLVHGETWNFPLTVCCGYGWCRVVKGCKDYQCECCGHTIAAGELHVYQETLANDSRSRERVCCPCYEFADSEDWWDGEMTFDDCAPAARDRGLERTERGWERPGEEVEVRVVIEQQPLWEEEPVMTQGGTWAGRYTTGDATRPDRGMWMEVDEREPPAAPGERVGVECLDLPMLTAIVLTELVPEQWCEWCGDVLSGVEREFTPCPTCDGFPPWVWRVKVRREETLKHDG